MLLRKYILKIIIILVMAVAGTIAAFEFNSMHRMEQLFPSKGLTKIAKLSDYHKDLKGTEGDSDVYFYDSGKEGATVLLAGGTHPNESAGYLAAIVILENLKIESGRIIIIPMLNQSAFTCTDPMEALPDFFEIKTENSFELPKTDGAFKIAFSAFLILPHFLEL